MVGVEIGGGRCKDAAGVCGVYPSRRSGTQSGRYVAGRRLAPTFAGADVRASAWLPVSWPPPSCARSRWSMTTRLPSRRLPSSFSAPGGGSSTGSSPFVRTHPRSVSFSRRREGQEQPRREWRSGRPAGSLRIRLAASRRGNTSRPQAALSRAEGAGASQPAALADETQSALPRAGVAARRPHPSFRGLPAKPLR